MTEPGTPTTEPGTASEDDPAERPYAGVAAALAPISEANDAGAALRLELWRVVFRPRTTEGQARTERQIDALMGLVNLWLNEHPNGVLRLRFRFKRDAPRVLRLVGPKWLRRALESASDHSPLEFDRYLFPMAMPQDGRDTLLAVSRGAVVLADTYVRWQAVCPPGCEDILARLALITVAQIEAVARGLVDPGLQGEEHENAFVDTYEELIDFLDALAAAGTNAGVDARETLAARREWRSHAEALGVGDLFRLFCPDE